MKTQKISIQVPVPSFAESSVMLAFDIFARS